MSTTCATSYVFFFSRPLGEFSSSEQNYSHRISLISSCFHCKIIKRSTPVRPRAGKVPRIYLLRNRKRERTYPDLKTPETSDELKQQGRVLLCGAGAAGVVPSGTEGLRSSSWCRGLIWGVEEGTGEDGWGRVALERKLVCRRRGEAQLRGALGCLPPQARAEGLFR